MDASTAQRLALVKVATSSSLLKGQLYLSQSGFLLLAVPNAIGRGLFAVLNEPGIELPEEYGPYNAHCTIMTAEEVANVGASNIKERGRDFAYQLGPVKEIAPLPTSPYSRVWALRIHSPELAKLRRSYGLSSQPVDNSQPFHCTIAVRKKHVLNENGESKTLRIPRKVSISRLSNLVGNEGSLQSKAASVLRELRRPRNHGMPSLVEELFGIPAGYGRAAVSAHAGSDRSERKLHTKELPMGHTEGSGQKQEKQSHNYGIRSEQNAGSMVRGVSNWISYRDKQAGQTGMVSGGGGSDPGGGAACGSSHAHIQRYNADTKGLGEGIEHIREDNTATAVLRMDSRRSAGNTGATWHTDIFKTGNDDNCKTAAVADIRP